MSPLLGLCFHYLANSWNTQENTDFDHLNQDPDHSELGKKVSHCTLNCILLWLLTLQSQSLLPRTEVEQPCNNNALTKTFFLPSRLLIFISFFLLFKRSQTKLYSNITESEVENFETMTKPRLFERYIPLFLIVESFSNSSFCGRTYSSSPFSLTFSSQITLVPEVFFRRKETR